MKRNSTIKFIGLDVHSKTISVAIADEGRFRNAAMFASRTTAGMLSPWHGFIELVN
jgi:hypothetical protein